MSFSFSHEPRAQKLWSIFYDFTQIPRPSKKEEKISKYLIDFAHEHNFNYKTDKIGNILIEVPGVGSSASSETVLIQNHIDMVTDAAPEVKINFEEDPIDAYVDGQWVRAKGTTLGADNGIGCAAALALAIDSSDHPPLELLFTIDEETGLTGAQELDGSIVSAKKVLNLDTEEWGSLYVGCAGGANYEFEKEFSLGAHSFDDPISLKLSVEGFNGGHSGVDIHRFRKNAIKALVEILNELDFDFAFSSIKAGKAHNIIPRDASANILISQSNLSKLDSVIESKVKSWNTYLSNEDLNFEVSYDRVEHAQACRIEDTNKILNILSLFPHGAHSFVRDTIKENHLPIVGISNNLALVHLVNGKLYLLSSLRFFNRSEAREVEGRFHTLAREFGLKISKNSEYPSWEPDFNTEILKKAINAYKSKFQVEPKIKAIHAGLECGILLDRMGGDAEAISFGPTIVDAHSPDERVNIDSVDLFWDYLKELINTI